MNKLLFTLLVMLFPLKSAYAQNEFDVKCHIKESLTDFFEHLSSVNDDDNPVSPYYLATEYRGNNYFFLNGKEIDFEDFIRDYAKKDLGKKFVNHTIVISNSYISKTSSTMSDHRYNVKGRLERKSATNEDYLVKDETVTAVVLFNGFEKQVSILELNFSKNLKISRPSTELEREFKVDEWNSTMHVPYKGGNWKISLLSKSRNVKRYPGLEDKTIYGAWSLTPYVVSTNINYKDDKKSQSLSGYLSANRSRRGKSYCITLTQEKTGNVIKKYIEQDGRPKRIFEYDQDPYHQIDIFYSLKYNFGLSYMYTFEDTPLSLGALIALNYDYFRDWFRLENGKLLDKKNPDITGKAISGYSMRMTTIAPNVNNYSDVLDPLEEAEHFTSRALLLAQGGYNIAQWLRFDLGIGASYVQQLHWMEKAYAVDIYHYEPNSPSIPRIGDRHVYYYMYEDYLYKDKGKWGFAVRPAVTFHLPLDKGFSKSIAIGAGYTFVTSLKEANSFDFTLGIRWKQF